MAEYRADRNGMDELTRSPRVRGLVELKAHEGAEFARNISPDAPPLTEGYIDSFEVSADVRRIARSRRAVAELANTSPHAATVEWGWSEAHNQGFDRAGYHVLGQTADVIGD